MGVTPSPSPRCSKTRITGWLLALIRAYQRYVSPCMPPHCRFYPTCSQYAWQAVTSHGAWHGSWLAGKRLMRCHPWGGYGVDFVPLPLYRYRFHLVENTPIILVFTDCRFRQRCG